MILTQGYGMKKERLQMLDILFVLTIGVILGVTYRYKHIVIIKELAVVAIFICILTAFYMIYLWTAKNIARCCFITPMVKRQVEKIKKGIKVLFFYTTVLVCGVLVANMLNVSINFTYFLNASLLFLVCDMAYMFSGYEYIVYFDEKGFFSKTAYVMFDDISKICIDKEHKIANTKIYYVSLYSGKKLVGRDKMFSEEYKYIQNILLNRNGY